jgi:hypothetical protein
MTALAMWSAELMVNEFEPPSEEHVIAPFEAVAHGMGTKLPRWSVMEVITPPAVTTVAMGIWPTDKFAALVKDGTQVLVGSRYIRFVAPFVKVMVAPA